MKLQLGNQGVNVERLYVRQETDYFLKVKMVMKMPWFEL